MGLRHLALAGERRCHLWSRCCARVEAGCWPTMPPSPSATWCEIIWSTSGWICISMEMSIRPTQELPRTSGEQAYRERVCTIARLADHLLPREPHALASGGVRTPPSPRLDEIARLSGGS